jgi:hypothetical protein
MVCRAEQWNPGKDTRMAALEEDGLKRASAELRWPLGRYVFRHAGHRNCASCPYDTGPGHRVISAVIDRINCIYRL